MNRRYEAENQYKMKDVDPKAWYLTNVPSELLECITYFLLVLGIGIVKDRPNKKKRSARTLSKLGSRGQHRMRRASTAKRWAQTPRQNTGDSTMLSDSVDSIEMPNVNVMKAKDMKQEEFLKTIPLFSHLKKGQFEDLNKFLTLKTFQMNEDIIVQGSTEVSMPMYIIKSGEVWCSIANETHTVDGEEGAKVTSLTLPGNTTSFRDNSSQSRTRQRSRTASMSRSDYFSNSRVVAKLGPGDVFGEAGIINTKPRAATCTSKSENTVCYELKGVDFLNVMSSGVDTGGKSSENRRKSIAVMNKNVMWSHRSDSLALATFAHNLQELYGALKGDVKKGAGVRKSFVEAIETPEYALHSHDDHEQLVGAGRHKKRMITALTTVLIYILKVTIKAMTALTVHLVGLKYLVI